MELDKSKVMINIDRYGNTTAATIPLCLSEWWQEGKIKKGHNLVLIEFRGGLYMGCGAGEVGNRRTEGKLRIMNYEL